jgi:elongation factor Ts
MVSVDQIKKLRDETDISISECRKSLEESNGDFEKAKEILKKRGVEIAQKKAERETKTGIIDSYIHPNKKVGVMLDIQCESDFVAKSPDFQKLSHELCLQLAAIDPEEIPFLEQGWIRDEKVLIKDLIGQYIAKIGENIIVKRFIRYEL